MRYHRRTYWRTTMDLMDLTKHTAADCARCQTNCPDRAAPFKAEVPAIKFSDASLDKIMLALMPIRSPMQ